MTTCQVWTLFVIISVEFVQCFVHHHTALGLIGSLQVTQLLQVSIIKPLISWCAENQHTVLTVGTTTQTMGIFFQLQQPFKSTGKGLWVDFKQVPEGLKFDWQPVCRPFSLPLMSWDDRCGPHSRVGLNERLGTGQQQFWGWQILHYRPTWPSNLCGAKTQRRKNSFFLSLPAFKVSNNFLSLLLHCLISVLCMHFHEKGPCLRQPVSVLQSVTQSAKHKWAND